MARVGLSGVNAVEDLREWAGASGDTGSPIGVNSRGKESDPLLARIEELEAYKLRFELLNSSHTECAYCLRVESDGTYMLEWVTDSFTRITGYKIENLAQLTSLWRQLLYPEDAGAWVQRASSLRAGNSDLAEFRIIRRDGAVRWLRDFAQPVRAAGEQEPLRIVGTATDITRDKRYEAALHKQAARNKALLDAMPDGYVELDEFHHIGRTNPAFCEMVGLASRDLLHRRLEEFLIAPDAFTFRRELAAAENGKGRRLRGTIAGMKGRPCEVEIGITMGGTAEKPRATLFFRDLTSLQSVARESNERVIERLLGQKLEALERLAACTADGFGTFLETIRARLDGALADPEIDGATLWKELEAASQALRKARLLANQLHAYGGRSTHPTERLRPNELLRSLEEVTRALMGGNVTIALHLSPSVGAIAAERDQFEQALLNLVVNANEAMPNGGRFTIDTERVELEGPVPRSLAALSPGPHIVLRISDTGVGMDAPTLERIWEPFFSTKQAGTDNGLGLASVWALVRRAGGTVRVDSALGEGTTFELFMPEVEGSSASVEIPTSLQAQRPGATVLVVDDDPSVRHLARSILERRGFHVMLASHPGEALLMVENHRGAIDILIADAVMPYVSGAALAARLHKLRPEMRALVLLDGEASPDVLGDDVWATLAKPFTPQELTRAVRAALATSSDIEGDGTNPPPGILPL